MLRDGSVGPTLCRGFFTSGYEMTYSCSYSVLLHHKGEPTVTWASVSCGSWKCSSCTEKRLKPAWVKHLSPIMLSLSNVYRTRVPVSEWATVSRRIRLTGGDYVRIRKGDHFAVYSSVQLDGSEALCRHDGKARMVRDIQSVRSGEGVRRPISTTRGWKMPPREDSDYERVSNRTVSKRSVEIAAKKHGCATARWTPKESPGVLDGLKVHVGGLSRDEFKTFIADCEASYPHKLDSLSTVKSGGGWYSRWERRVRIGNTTPNVEIVGIGRAAMDGVLDAQPA